MTKFVLIAAIAENGVIGDGDDMPWGRSLPDDLQRFKRISLNAGVVLMGRKTAQTLREPLANRRNIVLSTSNADLPKGFETYTCFQDAVAAVCREKVVAVIGGATIYKLFARYASLAYITLVRESFAGNVRFSLDALEHYTRKGDVTDVAADDRNKYAMQFVTLQNNKIESLGSLCR